MISGTVSTHLVRHLRAMALRCGVDPAAVDALPGMDPAALGDDLVRVPTSTAWRIWTLISVLDIEAAGVRAAAAAAPGTLHSWDYLFATGDTLADGMRAAAEYFPLVSDPDVALEVVEDGRLLAMRYATAEPDIAVMHDFEMAMVLRRIRDAAGTDVTPVRVSFVHRAPRRHRYLAEAFGTANFEFGAEANEITFLDAGTRARARPADPGLDQIILRYSDMVMASAKSPPDWHATFRALVAESLERNEATLDTVASRLFISTRTLQRRLEERDTSWRDEVEAVRHEQVRRLLTETELTVGSIASRVGYADARTLRKAFLRWTGQTPDAYRRGSRG